MGSEFGWYTAPFGVDDLIEKGRRGSYPDGYLDTYLAHLRRSHAASQAKIGSIFAEAAADPVELARLQNLRF